MKKHKRSFIEKLAYSNSPRDERQNVMFTRILAETFGGLMALGFLNVWIMEDFYKWCETYSNSMFIIFGIGLIYFVLRCGTTGCLFGIRGVAYGMTFSAIVMAVSGILGIYNALTLTPLVKIDGEFQEVPFAIVRNGALTGEFSMLIYQCLYIIYAIILWIYIIREKKAEKRGGNSGKDA